MTLSTLDWSIMGLYFLFVLIVGIMVSRKAGDSVDDFFLSGRNMTWWLLGISMVATTFSADTPNLVTDLVRQNGHWAAKWYKQQEKRIRDLNLFEKLSLTAERTSKKCQSKYLPKTLRLF